MVTVAYRPGLLFQSGAGEIWPRKPPPSLWGAIRQKAKIWKSKKQELDEKSRNANALVPVWEAEQVDQGVQSLSLRAPIRQQAKIWKEKNRRKKCYSDTLGPYNGVQAGLIKGAGTFHSTSQRKEGILVLALPSIRFSWNCHQIISGTKYE